MSARESQVPSVRIAPSKTNRSRLQLVPGSGRRDGVTATFDDPTETTIFAQLVRLAVESLSAGRVLDVGCGSAVPTLEAARAGAHGVVGIDCERSSVELARNNIRRAGLEARVSAHWASWEDVCTGRFPIAPDLVVSNPPYVPGGQGRAVDGGLYGTSVLNDIIDNVPASTGGLALLFGSINDPLSVLARIVARGFELTHLLAYSVGFGRYTSLPATLAHLKRLRTQGKAWFCDVAATAGGAPHAYLTLGIVGRRSSDGDSSSSDEIIGALSALLPEYQKWGPTALAG